MFTKSGIMVGLGETREQVLQVMDDMRSADIDFITIGQYLQPTRKHAAIDRFVTPDEFKAYETTAYAKGFLMVASSPLTRSSHHAGDDFAQAARSAGARARPDMPKFSVSRTSAFTAQQVFDVVADIEAYPKFVPLCRSARLSIATAD